MMKRLFFLPLLLLACLSGAVSKAQERVIHYPADPLFDLAEAHFPGIFPSSEATQVLDVVEVEYFYYNWYGNLTEVADRWRWLYRHYSQTNTYLVVNSRENAVYVSGPAFGPEILKVGQLDDILKLFPAGIIKPGSGECVDVGSPEPGMIAYYGPKLPGPGYLGGVFSSGTGRPDSDSVVSWYPGAQGDVEVQRHAGSFLGFSNAYAENEHLITNAGLTYLLSSSRTYSGPQSSSVELVPNLQSKATHYGTPGLLLGPSSRYCVGQSWLSAPVAKIITRTYFPNSPAAPIQSESEQTETTLSASYVISVNTPITVQAGQFNTVVIATNGVKRWIDIETGIVVKGSDYIWDTSEVDWYWAVFYEWWERRPTARIEGELYALDFSGKCQLRICDSQ